MRKVYVLLRMAGRGRSPAPLIEMGEVAEGKALLETQMILNHKAAIELLVDNIETVGFDRYTLMNVHATLAENLMPNPTDEGRVRNQMGYIGQSVYRPLGSPPRIEVALDMLLDKAGVVCRRAC